MSHWPGKPKSGNVVLPAGYTTALLVTIVAERNESWPGAHQIGGDRRAHIAETDESDLRTYRCGTNQRA